MLGAREKRTVTGSINVQNGRSLSFILCNRYMNKLGEERTTTTTNGSFHIELEINTSHDCWVLDTTPKIPLFVYEGKGELNLVDAMEFSQYPSLYHDDEMDLLNFDCLLNRYLEGEPIVSNEEARVLCDYFAFATGKSTNKRMCELDKGLVNGL